MLNGDLDVSVSAEYPVIMAIMGNKRLDIIGTIDRYQNEEIIGRRDRGIENISGLKGKRMGVARGTICEFFLGRFLNLQGMNLSDVNLIDIPASEAVDAILKGRS
jgi:sulfonate transport system substrate-binding protein